MIMNASILNGNHTIRDDNFTLFLLSNLKKIIFRWLFIYIYIYYLKLL